MNMQEKGDLDFARTAFEKQVRGQNAPEASVRKLYVAVRYGCYDYCVDDKAALIATIQAARLEIYCQFLQRYW